jgi:hypothetical protein
VKVALAVNLRRAEDPRGESAHRPCSIHQKVLAMRHLHINHFEDRYCVDMVASGITGRTRPTKVKKRENLQKRKRDDVDVEKLEQAVQELVRSRRATDLSIRS